MDIWPCGYMATWTWMHGHIYVDTRTCAYGYTVMCMWIHGDMHIAQNQIQLMNTWPLLCGYMFTWIYGHVHVDTQSNACENITTGFTWEPILIQFKAGIALWPIVWEPESVQWPTEPSRILPCGPQRLRRLCAVAHIAKVLNTLNSNPDDCKKRTLAIGLGVIYDPPGDQ